MSMMWLAVGVLVVSVMAGFVLPKTRYWLVAMMSGMCYWVFLEIVRYGAIKYFAVNTMQGYLLGVALSLIGFSIWLAIIDAAHSVSATTRARKFARQIEHTPLHPHQLTRRS